MRDISEQWKSLPQRTKLEKLKVVKLIVSLSTKFMQYPCKLFGEHRCFLYQP